MFRVLRLLAPCLGLVVVAVLVGACESGLRTPDVVGTEPGVAVARTVDPAIDTWFRATRATGAGTVVTGDRIRVELQGLPEYSITREVPPDGVVPLFRAARPLQAKGRTVQELETAVAAAYEGTLDAYVTVTVVAQVPRVVYLAGAVRNPQAYPIRGGERLTLLQALTLAGGPAESADLQGVTIMRLHPELGRVVSSAPLDVQSVQSRGDQTDNLIVLPGDTVVVPEATARQVHILGHVERPGQLRWYDGITLSRAVTEAGGFKTFARQDAIRVVRAGGRETFVFDFSDLLAGRIQDLVLVPGDVIYVDERWL